MRLHYTFHTSRWLPHLISKNVVYFFGYLHNFTLQEVIRFPNLVDAFLDYRIPFKNLFGLNLDREFKSLKNWHLLSVKLLNEDWTGVVCVIMCTRSTGGTLLYVSDYKYSNFYCLHVYIAHRKVRSVSSASWYLVKPLCNIEPRQLVIGTKS